MPYEDVVWASLVPSGADEGKATVEVRIEVDKAMSHQKASKLTTHSFRLLPREVAREAVALIVVEVVITHGHEGGVSWRGAHSSQQQA